SNATDKQCDGAYAAADDEEAIFHRVHLLDIFLFGEGPEIKHAAVGSGQNAGDFVGEPAQVVGAVGLHGELIELVEAKQAFLHGPDGDVGAAVFFLEHVVLAIHRDVMVQQTNNPERLAVDRDDLAKRIIVSVE